MGGPTDPTNAPTGPTGGYAPSPMGYPPPPGAGASPALYGMPPAPPGTQYDTETGVVVPQGTQVASIGRRVGAFFLQILLAIVTLGIGYAIWGLIEWGNGRTPVQRVLGLRCYKPAEGRVCGWTDMFLRELIWFLCGVFWYVPQLVNLVIFLTNDRRQGLHDMAAGSVVLYDPAGVIP